MRQQPSLSSTRTIQAGLRVEHPLMSVPPRFACFCSGRSDMAVAAAAASALRGSRSWLRTAALPAAAQVAGLCAPAGTAGMCTAPAAPTPAETFHKFQQRLQAAREKALVGGGEKRIAKQHAKGKLTARERLDVFLDEGSFREYDQLKQHRCVDFGMAEESMPGDGVVTGHGTVDGRLVFVFSQDFT
ncbi:pccB, partial [Symbiodinium sp. KB8]